MGMMHTIEVSFKVIRGHLQRSYEANLATILQTLSGNNSEVRQWVS